MKFKDCIKYKVCMVYKVNCFMIKVEITAFAFFICTSVFAQVGIGTVSPDDSAALDITVFNEEDNEDDEDKEGKGLLIPRLTSNEITGDPDNPDDSGIENPANGLLVYDTTENQFKVNYGDASNPLWDYVNPNAGSDSVKYSVDIYSDDYQSAISVSPTYTTIPLLQSEDWNDNTEIYQVSTEDHTITVSQAGRYRISVSVPLQINLNAADALDRFSITEMQIAVNGNEVGTPRVTLKTGVLGQGFNYMDITEVMMLNANDIISIVIKTTGETSLIAFYNSNPTGNVDDGLQRKVAYMYLEQL